MKFDLSTIAVAVLAVALPAVNAVCASGEIGVGLTEEYQGNQRIAMNPGLYANNCNSIAFSSAGLQRSPCKGDWGKGYSVGCDGNGNPNSVKTTGGNFNNCYRISNGQCATGPLTYINVYFCCKRA